MKPESLPENMKILLKEMCLRVGADFDVMDFTKPDWYSDFTWTEKEQEAYIDWLVTYLLKDKKRQIKVLAYPTTNKKMMKRFADEFLLNYCWRCEYPER